MVGPLIVRGVGMLAKAAVKKGAKKVVKKKVVKKKVTSQQTLERMLRAENKGDALTAGRIKRLRAQERNGLISPGERQRALNRLTKSHKALQRKKRR